VANRYWVGGTATWDGTALLKWSTTSGGIGGSAVPTTSDTVFFDAASGANTVTIGVGVATCSTLTMTGFTGTLAFGTNKITIAGTGTIFTGATTYSVTGTPVIDCTNSSSSALSLSPAVVTEANSISFNITASSGTFSLGSSQAVKSLNFTGYTGNMLAGARTIYGNLTLSTGMSLTASTSTTTFGATSGTQTITSNTKTMDFPITFAGTATYQLVDALTSGSTRTMTLTSGTLDLNNKTLTTGIITVSGASTRSILFGTIGNIALTGSNTIVFAGATLGGFTYTGTPTVNLTYSGSVGTRTVNSGNTSGGTETNVLNFNITAGSDTVSLAIQYKNIDFTGFTGTFANNTRIIYGNLTLVSGMSLTAGTLGTTFAATSGTQTITSAAQTLDFPITINGVGGTVQLVDALTMGSTRTLTLTNGTFNSNDKNITCGAFSGNNTNTKALNLGTSTITIQSGSSTAGFAVSAAGTTYTSIANSTIVFTTTATSVFSGGAGAGTGNQYGTVTMSGLGGTLYLGSSTSSTTLARCTTLNNTVSPCTITNACTTGFTVTNFNLSGTAGNLVTFNSNTVGTARTISQATGTVNALYLNVKDSTATGGAKWYANSSNDLGNNTGWNIFNNSFLAVF